MEMSGDELLNSLTAHRIRQAGAELEAMLSEEQALNPRPDTDEEVWWPTGRELGLWDDLHILHLHLERRKSRLSRLSNKP